MERLEKDFRIGGISLHIYETDKESSEIIRKAIWQLDPIKLQQRQ
jgi:hypothetical protein